MTSALIAVLAVVGFAALAYFAWTAMISIEIGADEDRGCEAESAPDDAADLDWDRRWDEELTPGFRMRGSREKRREEL